MFAAPLGLLALLAVPAIVALHLFRRRFQPRTVSALFLWADADRTPLAGRKKEKLRASLSLWSEVLAALCLALAFAGLRGCGDQPGEHLVAVLDASASMGAESSGTSSAARARAALAERIEALPRGSRVTLVASGANPSVLAGPAAFPEEAAKALAGFEPRAQRHDLASSVAFALQVFGGGRVVVYSDRYEPDRFPPEVELAAVGVPLDNVGIARAGRERARRAQGAAAEERAFVVLQNFGARTARAVVNVATADAPRRELAPARELELAPGERASLSWSLPAGTGPIAVELAPDALAIDDVALLAPVPARTLALATTFDEAEARALGLMSTGGASRIDRLLGTLEDALLVDDPTTAHLVLGRGVAGGAATWNLSIEPLGAERKDFIGPFLFEKRHPLLEGVTLEGLVWSADPALALAGVPLVAAGNLPLLVEDELAGRRVFRFDLDPARSSLARSPDWPILLSNLCELRRRSLPGPDRTNLEVGDDLSYRASAATDGARGDFVFEREDGGVPPRRWPPRPSILVDSIDRPGLYRLAQDGATLCRVAVRFSDPSESDLTKLGSGKRPAQTDAARLEASASWVEALLLAVATAAIALDWFVLRRARRALGTDGASAAPVPLATAPDAARGGA
ncbi:MAG: VWA domain-containing protein [Planctomycetes bacterium]|nr:VWA domain-containing protein [Planctomycetota bacterium]